MIKKIFRIRLTPNAKADQLVEQQNDFLKIKLIATPQKGKANQSLIKFLSQHFKIPKKNIAIISGEKSRDKKIQVLFDN
jgi:hypothetical protein